MMIRRVPDLAPEPKTLRSNSLPSSCIRGLAWLFIFTAVKLATVSPRVCHLMKFARIRNTPERSKLRVFRDLGYWNEVFSRIDKVWRS